jgi:Mg-chelatase subunit ChlD
MKPLTSLVRTFLGAIVAVACAGEARAQLGPILRITPPPFDTTLCGTSECRALTFSNVGDAPLTIFSISGIDAPFAGGTPTPLTILPGSPRTLQICYSPTVAPRRDTSIVNVRADGRLSLSIAMLFDASGSMGNPIMFTGSDTASTTTTRIAAANAAGKEFIKSLVDTLGVRDEAAVIRFSNGWQVLRDFTSNRADLNGAFPIAASGGTCLYDAVIRTGNLLRTRNVAGRRVMIILSDGDDAGCAGLTLTDALQSVQTPDPIRIFTVGVGGGLSAAGTAALQQLAATTRGRYFQAVNAQDLITVYQSIARLLSQDTLDQSFTMTARAVTPIMAVSPGIVTFDSVRVGERASRSVTIRNIGDAPMAGIDTTGFSGAFTATIGSIAPILPGDSAIIPIAFTPTFLRVQSGAGTFTYNGCSALPATVAFGGVGYDTLTLAVRDSIRARAGSRVLIPVYIDSILPAAYMVDSLALTVEYNRTLLYPLDTPVVTTGTPSDGMTIEPIATVYDGTLARTTYRLRGNTLASATPGAIILRLAFLALHGNAVSTPVTITGASFADGNPRMGATGPAFYEADSLCYLDQRLIDASPRYLGLLKRVATDRGGATATIGYQILAATTARLTLHDELGRQVRELFDGPADAGEFERSFPTSDLPNGIYYLRLMAGGTQDVKLLVVAK